MTLLLIILPALLAGFALLIPSNRGRPWLLPLAGMVHLPGTFILLLRRCLHYGLVQVWSNTSPDSAFGISTRLSVVSNPARRRN